MQLTFAAGAHAYLLNGQPVPSVTQVLKDVGVIDTSWFPAGSADFGQQVHRALELYDRGTLDEAGLDPAFHPYLSAWQDFRIETGFVPELIEHRVVSETFRYAGTLDRFGRMSENRPALVDIKSGAVPDWTGLQLAGYEEALPGEGRPLRMAVQVTAEGKYRIHQFNSRSDRGTFLAAATVYHWKHRKGNV
jgi:hypothetical protein